VSRSCCGADVLWVSRAWACADSRSTCRMESGTASSAGSAAVFALAYWYCSIASHWHSELFPAGNTCPIMVPLIRPPPPLYLATRSDGRNNDYGTGKPDHFSPELERMIIIMEDGGQCPSLRECIKGKLSGVPSVFFPGIASGRALTYSWENSSQFRLFFSATINRDRAKAAVINSNTPVPERGTAPSCKQISPRISRRRSHDSLTDASPMDQLDRSNTTKPKPFRAILTDIKENNTRVQ